MAAYIRTTKSPTSLTVVEPLELLNECDMLAQSYWETPVSGALIPSVDMFEKGDELVIRAELPGVRKQTLDINIVGEELNIKAEGKVPEDSNFFVSERCFGHYFRSLSLPYPVNAEKSSATFENGLLEIRLFKAEEAKGKHITIK